jgi:hypothetical protein
LINLRGSVQATYYLAMGIGLLLLLGTSIPCAASGNLLVLELQGVGAQVAVKSPDVGPQEPVRQPEEIPQQAIEQPDEDPQQDTEPDKDMQQVIKPPKSPERAAMLSATLPGLGQVYNGRYWKVPIIYAGFGTLAYFLNMNSTEYQRWRAAYIARVDGDPNTVDGYPHSTDQLERAMNFYRRNLEVTYLLGAALYILNILDANVDAHLLDFDVREDLSMRLQPIMNRLPPGGSVPGISFTIRF